MKMPIRLRLPPLHLLSFPSTGTSLHANVSDWAGVFKSMTSCPGRSRKVLQVSPRKVDFWSLGGVRQRDSFAGKARTLTDSSRVAPCGPRRFPIDAEQTHQA